MEADETTRKRLERTIHKDLEDFIAGREINSLSHHNLVHKFIPMPQALKTREAEATGEERMAKSRPPLKLVSKTVASSSTARSLSASNCPGKLKASSQSLSLTACAGKPAAEDSNQNDAASSSRAWQSDVKPNVSAEDLLLQKKPKLGPLSTCWATCSSRCRHRRRRLRVAKQFPDICCFCPTS